MEPTASAAPDEERRLLDQELALLRAIPGISGVDESTYSGPELNKMDVHARVRVPGSSKAKYMRRSCSAEFDTKLKAARELKRKITELVGRELVEQAEAETMGSARPPAQMEPPTTEELEWLASWIDQHPSPDSIGVAESDAALRSRRASVAGAAAMEQLMERPLAEAKLCAAELRLKRAQQEVARAKAALPDVHDDKRQHAEPPAWAGREYAGYETVEYWRQEEGRIYNRRRKEISAGQGAARKIDLEPRLPSGFCVALRARAAPHEPHAKTQPQTLHARENATLLTTAVCLCVQRNRRGSPQRNRAVSATGPYITGVAG